MNEKPGVATRLMYQLFVALERKKQRKLTGQSLECMRPSAKVKLEKIETGIFQQRLKHQTPRQVDLSFDALVHKFQDRQKQYEELLAHEKHAETERLARVIYNHLNQPPNTCLSLGCSLKGKRLVTNL